LATFGNLNAGSTSVQTPPTNNKAVSKFTLDRAGVVDAVSVVFTAGSGNTRAVLYDATGVGGLPGARVGVSTARGVGGGAQTAVFTFSPGVTLSAGDYWLGLISDSFGTSNCVALTNGIAFNANTYASGASDPFGASPSMANFRYPVNAGYTPTLGAGTYAGETRGGETATDILANRVAVFKVIPTTTISATKLTVFLANTYASAKVKGVIYDATGSGGTPGTLLRATAELTGPLINGNDLTLTSSLILNAGVTYYIGVHVDTQITVYTRTAASSGYSATQTYASGPPSTYPASPTPTNEVPALWASGTGSPTYPITVTATQATAVRSSYLICVPRQYGQVESLTYG